MSKFAKLALLLAVVATLFGVHRLITPSDESSSANAAESLAFISPDGLMRTAGPLHETKVADYF